MAKELPQAIINTQRNLSLVWLIPIVAALIAIWLMYKAASEKGPSITVEFQQAAGIEAGKTRIKYKDVEVGKVKHLRLNKDLSRVKADIEMLRFMDGHLNENTRFWVVRPRISSSGVSGLNTLISGIYIAVDPGKGDQTQRHFTGLEQAPEIDSLAKGKHFTLHASNLGALDISSPIYYRQLQVGEVTHYMLDDEGKNVEIHIFIEAPYDALVHSNSRFWNASGFNIQLDSSGIRAELQSIASLISGGIAFDTPRGLNAGAIAANQASFRLHQNLESVKDEPYQITKYFILNFDSSLRGLQKGAPVEFRGIKVGEVIDINLQMDHETLDVATPVLIGVYTERVNLNGMIPDEVEVFNTLVERGLRAQLKSGNLITGQLYVDLEFVKNAPKARITKATNGYLQFPTVPAALEKITRNVTDLLDKFGKIPFNTIASNLQETIDGLNKIVNSKHTSRTMADLRNILANVRSISTDLKKDLNPITQKIESSLTQLETTLSTADTVIAEDSPLYYDIRQLIDELSSAANSFEILTDYLERHPNALLLGKPEN